MPFTQKGNNSLLLSTLKLKNGKQIKNFNKFEIDRKKSEKLREILTQISKKSEVVIVK